MPVIFPVSKQPSMCWVMFNSARFAGTEANLLWYKDTFANGRKSVQYQALVVPREPNEFWGHGVL